MRLQLASFVIASGIVAAQDPSGLALTRLHRLGPLPVDAVELTLEPGGSLRGGHAEPLSLELLLAKAADSKDGPLLRVDRDAPFSAVAALLDACCRSDIPAVRFAATLPDGTPGCFTLALPRGEPQARLHLRLHRERPGVSAESVTPILRRMVRGLAAAGEPPLVLGLHAPGDARFEQVLWTMAAVSRAGVEAVVVCSEAVAHAGAVPARGLAIDLGPAPHVQVPPLALPLPRPAIASDAVGCTARPTTQERRVSLLADPVLVRPRILDDARSWWTRQQMADGRFADDAGDDVTATALVVLTCLGDGSTLGPDPEAAALSRAIGWLIAQQRFDGRFGPGGAGATTRNALATWALAKTFGTSPNGGVLRGSVDDGLEWLFAHQRSDGGWNDGSDDTPANALDTAWCCLATASAQIFDLRMASRTTDAVAWFDRVADARTGAHRLQLDADGTDPRLGPAATAAALLCRCAAGQDPRESPLLRKSATFVAENADPKDPRTALFATLALYQVGGREWAGWSRGLTAAIVATQHKDGEFAGSWDPPPGGSRCITSAMRMLTLQVYYRYSRLVR